VNEEAVEILKALKAGQELLIAKIDGIDIRLAKLEGEVRAVREKQEEQDKVVDILSVRTTRLQARL
jgi:hypothetical protein